MLQQQQAKQEQKKKEKEEEQQKVEDQVLRNYELSDFKGKGAYGIVWKAIDRKTLQPVALKKIFDAFHNSTDAQRTFREVIYLEQMTQHDNIVKLLNVIKADNDKDLYMIFEYVETDLHKVIRAGILENIHKKYIIYQILKALKYIHSGDLIHRDLKPSNILIDAQCKIKLADFGLARSLHVVDEDTPVLTEYVATRWYRAPEILLGSQQYSKAVDIWSVGCMLGEMIAGRAIFPGNSTLNQIERIIELIGRPKISDFEAMQAPMAMNVTSNIHTQKKRTFAQQFDGGSDDAIDLIRKCLIYDPKQRITIADALCHPYVKEFYQTEIESVCEKKITCFLDDNKKFTVKEYRSALYNHINSTKQQQNKNLLIKFQRIQEGQSLGSSPEKTESKKNYKQVQPQNITEENAETIKRFIAEKTQKKNEEINQDNRKQITRSHSVIGSLINNMNNNIINSTNIPHPNDNHKNNDNNNNNNNDNSNNKNNNSNNKNKSNIKNVCVGNIDNNNHKITNKSNTKVVNNNDEIIFTNNQFVQDINQIQAYATQQKNFFHCKSQSQNFISNNFVVKNRLESHSNQTSQLVINTADDNELGNDQQNKQIKQQHRRLISVKTGISQDQQNIFPIVEGTPTNITLSRSGSQLEKKMKSSIALITQNNQGNKGITKYSSYFLNGTKLQQSRKNSFKSTNSNQNNYVVQFNGSINTEIQKNDPYKNYLSVKQLMSGTLNNQGYQSKIKQRK